MMKTAIFFMIIIMSCQLCAFEIRADGKILIPTAEGERSYPCVISLTAEGIRLECQKKIFWSLNMFEDPPKATLKINFSDIKDVSPSLLSTNTWFIESYKAFYNKYRNLFHEVVSYWGEYWALAITVDYSTHSKAALIELALKYWEVLPGNRLLGMFFPG